jgi:4-hydroxyphenylpyruvate dioxygenase-like putative hemolysin
VLALLIWSFETQVMAKKRARSQTANLTPDQKKSGIDLIYLATDNMRHTIEKLLTRAITLLQAAP